MGKVSFFYNKHNFIKRGYFYVGIVAIIAMISFNNFSSVHFSPVIFLGVFFVFASLCERNELLALIACCIPFSVGFQYKFGILICLTIYFIKYYKDIELKWPIIILFSFIAFWELIHVVMAKESIYFYARDFFGVILCVYIALTSLKFIDYPFIIRVFVFASIGIMIVLFIEQLTQNSYNFRDVFKKGFRFGSNKQAANEYALLFNPNMLGFICNMCIVGIMQLLISKRYIILDFLLIIPPIFFGVMTMSRAFLFCFTIILFMFLIVGKVSVRKKLIRACITIGLLLIIVLFVFILMPTVVEGFIKRFKVDDISNHRIELFVFYNKHIFSSKKYYLFGIGLQSVGQKLLTMYPEIIYVCHNGIQQIVIAWGIPGILAFTALMFCIVRKALKRVKFSLLNFMPMILICVNIQFDQFLSEGLTLIMLAISIVSINYDFYARLEELEVERNKNLLSIIFSAIIGKKSNGK